MIDDAEDLFAPRPAPTRVKVRKARPMMDAPSVTMDAAIHHSEPPPPPERDIRFKPNPGYCPDEAKGKRVRVLLATGAENKDDDNPMSPKGWPADGMGGCNWTRRGFPFDIEWYRVL